jgi:AAA family ATP:ADP antiporter
MFFIIFNNTMVRNLKDCFLVMNSGALSTAFIKLWGILPATFLALLLFAKISNLMKQENVFYFFISIFLLFFALFGFVILPNQESMPLHAFADWLRFHFGAIDIFSRPYYGYRCLDLWR